VSANASLTVVLSAVIIMSKGGVTALLYAVRQNNFELCSLLIEHGANIEAKDWVRYYELILSNNHHAVSRYIYCLE
jgi:ankyrin repeat protein